MKCDWCEHTDKKNPITISGYKVTGILSGRKRTKTIRICNCCSAWGVLSDNWHGLKERLEKMTGYDNPELV